MSFSRQKGKDFLHKAGLPLNKLANKLNAEAFSPTSLDQEADKAARVLGRFCLQGFVPSKPSGPPKDTTSSGPSNKHIEPALLRIPAEASVISQAKGLVIFTSMRIGFQFGGAGGSGILIARLPDGTWSPPSGILVHTLAVGFLIGVDIYDAVCVINTEEALEGFKRVRCTLGGEVGITAGPLGVGTTLDSEVFNRRAPTWSYAQSKGLYAGLQLSGTVIVERDVENAEFYGQKGIRGTQILAGHATPPPGTCDRLWETLRTCDSMSHTSSG